MDFDKVSQQSVSTVKLGSQDPRMRVHSQMTYNEFVKIYDRPPRCPQLKPIEPAQNLFADYFTLENSRPHALTMPDKRNTVFKNNEIYNLQLSDEEENVDFEDDGSQVGDVHNSVQIKNKFNNNINQKLYNDSKQINLLQQQKIKEERQRAQTEQTNSIFGILERKRQQTESNLRNYVM